MTSPPSSSHFSLPQTQSHLQATDLLLSPRTPSLQVFTWLAPCQSSHWCPDSSSDWPSLSTAEKEPPDSTTSSSRIPSAPSSLPEIISVFHCILRRWSQQSLLAYMLVQDLATPPRCGIKPHSPESGLACDLLLTKVTSEAGSEKAKAATWPPDP